MGLGHFGKTNNCPARQCGFAGPGKREAELRQAVASGVLLHVESARELRALADAAQALGRPARVALRINPDFELRGAGMHMGGGPKPFGIDASNRCVYSSRGLR